MAEPPFELDTLELGKLYDPERTSFPEEASIFLGPSGMIIRFIVAAPLKDELRSFDRKVSLRFFVGHWTIMFLFRFGDGPWNEAAYNIHYVSAKDNGLHPGEPLGDIGWLLGIVTVDANNGIVRHLRRLYLTRNFSCAILRALERQRSQAADYDAHVAEIAQMQRKSTAQLAAAAIDRFEESVKAPDARR